MNQTPPMMMQLIGEENLDSNEWEEGTLEMLIRKHGTGEELTKEDKIKIIVLLKWVHSNNPWPEDEVMALVEELKQEKNEAIDKAVAAAVIEYRGEIVAKEAEIEDLEGINEDLIDINKSMRVDNFKYAIGGGLAGALIATIVILIIGR